MNNGAVSTYPTANNFAWPIDVCWLTVVLFVLYFFCLGTPPLGVPDGARYAEIGREMLHNHHYLLPHLNGILYLEKPPLFYWLQALAFHWFGLNEWAARFWIAVMAISLCLLNYSVAFYFFGRRCARLACLMLATSSLFFAMAHRISIDMSLTFFLTITLYSFLAGIVQRIRPRFLYLSYFTAGLAVLCKGLIGVLFPMAIIGLWVIVNNEWRLVPRMRIVSGLLLTFIIAAPWHVLVQMHVPTFFNFYFLEQQFLRYFTSVADRYQPYWYFLPILAAGFFPWVSFLPTALVDAYVKKSTPTGQRVTRFLFVWAVGLFVFFSFSHSKLIPYILPVMPPLALLTAYSLDSRWQKFSNTQIAFASGLLLLTGIAITTLLIVAAYRQPWPTLSLAKQHLFAMATVCLISTLFATYQLLRRHLTNVCIILCTGNLALLLILASAVTYLDDRPIKPIATTLATQLKPGDIVVAYDHYYQDLPFYLKQPVKVANWINEFEFGKNNTDTSNQLLTNAAFWQLWRSKQTVYAVFDLQAYEHLHKIHPDMTFTPIKRSNSDILVSNQATNKR